MHDSLCATITYIYIYIVIFYYYYYSVVFKMLAHVLQRLNSGQLHELITTLHLPKPESPCAIITDTTIMVAICLQLSLRASHTYTSPTGAARSSPPRHPKLALKAGASMTGTASAFWGSGAPGAYLASSSIEGLGPC